MRLVEQAGVAQRGREVAPSSQPLLRAIQAVVELVHDLGPPKEEGLEEAGQHDGPHQQGVEEAKAIGLEERDLGRTPGAQPQKSHVAQAQEKGPCPVIANGRPCGSNEALLAVVRLVGTIDVPHQHCHDPIEAWREDQANGEGHVLHVQTVKALGCKGNTTGTRSHDTESDHDEEHSLCSPFVLHITEPQGQGSKSNASKDDHEQNRTETRMPLHGTDIALDHAKVSQSDLQQNPAQHGHCKSHMRLQNDRQRVEDRVIQSPDVCWPWLIRLIAAGIPP